CPDRDVRRAAVAPGGRRQVGYAPEAGRLLERSARRSAQTAPKRPSRRQPEPSWDLSYIRGIADTALYGRPRSPPGHFHPSFVQALTAWDKRGAPMRDASCAAKIVASARTASNCSLPRCSSTAKTPTQPPGVINGTTSAPHSAAQLLTTHVCVDRKAAAVAL